MDAPAAPFPRRRETFAVVLLFLVALIPSAMATWPPLMDFPNHLARIWLMAGGAAVPPLSYFYRIDLAQAYGDFGLDLAAAGLARVLPIERVGQILAALATLGPPLGGLALNRAITRQFHAGQIALLALAWSTTALAGFLAFQTSLAVALALSAAKVAGARGGVFFDTLACALLLTLHPLGVGFYVLIGMALRIGEHASGLRRLGALAGEAARLLIAAAVPLVGRRLLLPAVGQDSASGFFWGDPRNILDPLHAVTIWVSPLLSYDLRADLPAALLTAALVGAALWRGALRLHAGLALTGGALWLVSPLLPDAFGDGSWLSHRFPIQGALLFAASLRPGSRPREPLALGLGVVVAARTLWIAGVWSARQSDVADLTFVLQGVAPGAAVVVVQQEARDWRAAPTGRFIIGSPNGVRATRRHMGGFAVVEARVFVPTLFAVPGQHPLTLGEGLGDWAVTASSIPYPRQLDIDSAGDAYLKIWRGFDYVLVLNADIDPASDFDAKVSRRLESLADRGFARLYRIVRGPISSPNR